MSKKKENNILVLLQRLYKKPYYRMDSLGGKISSEREDDKHVTTG